MKYALINANVLDGRKDMAPFFGYITVENGKITAVCHGDADEKTLYEHKIIDLDGKYVMPGLINMHVHLAGNGKPQIKQRDNAKLVKLLMSNPVTKAVAYKLVASFAKTELYSGVTTIRTVGGLADFDTKLRDQIASGKKVGPRILAANRGISVPNGHMAGSVAITAHNADEALAYLDECKAQKTDFIKLMITGGVMDAKEKGVPGEVKMSAETVKAVCDKAHSLGFMVAAHVESPSGVKLALENGVDSIEHGAKADDEIIALFKERGAFLCTTISPALPYALFDRAVTNVNETEQYNGNVVFEGIIDCAKAAVANGIPVVLGNDVGCPWITQYDFWRELCYFAKYVGVSNAFALYTATLGSAEVARIDDVTGSIEQGKFADLIITESNPLDDLRALSKIETVIAKGKIIKHPRVAVKKRVKAELDKYLF